MIVADAGPLIALACAGLIELPAQVAGIVYVPPAVRDECIADPARPGARTVSVALDRAVLVVRAPMRPLSNPPAALGAGEQEALALGLELECPVMLDEKLARRAGARLGVAVFGSTALLLAARQRGLLDAIAPVLARMRANGYHLSDALVAQALALAKEA